MTSLIKAVIDTDALRSNLERIRSSARGSRVMAVVKANAYGHGLVPTALALPGSDAFAVARLEEGIKLFEAGVRQPIVLLEGVFTREQLREAATRRFEIVVHDSAQIDLLENLVERRRFTIWLKVDTGMNRLGFRIEEFPKALARLRALNVPPKEIRLLTHLARADERDCPMTIEQLKRFRELTVGYGFVTSISNSAGIFGWRDARCDWVRPGVALYGVSPFPDESAESLGLKPAMTLESTVIATRRVLRGESVGYGATWRAAQDSRIAILAGGYGDGLIRSETSGTPVMIEGHRVPLVGRISMDMVAADITSYPSIAVGAKAMFWGKGLPVEEIARHAGTIPYELLCGVSLRVPLELR